MSNWLSKSINSFAIANNAGLSVFNDNRVHCFYYGCVQLLKHVVLNNFNGMDVEQVENECNPKKKPENKGTHQYLKLKIKEDLNNRSERLVSVDFNSKLLALQNLRTKADYGIDNISQLEIENAKQYSDLINNTLNKFYKI
ncbi:hypothetical protein FA048_09115 [Pedobacter polaris]|uniref:HEPN domain-containing protein n=1 Tax=Pedobacter polaris TaxID=2571273 RepID=A0A4U1CTD4_9SPHI|nr:hypothetical protein [Pedobacter polaris]TKC10340.1 hypothetical protein FA048_09115 [Pedobacter polaris]